MQVMVIQHLLNVGPSRKGFMSSYAAGAVMHELTRATQEGHHVAGAIEPGLIVLEAAAEADLCRDCLLVSCLPRCHLRAELASSTGRPDSLWYVLSRAMNEVDARLCRGCSLRLVRFRETRTTSRWNG